MDFPSAKFIFGTTAAICTTSAFIPQILKIRRSGGRDVSYGMLLLFLVGVVLWLAYGIVIRAGAVIAANGIATCLVSICLVLKSKYARQRRASATSHLPAQPAHGPAATEGLPAD